MCIEIDCLINNNIYNDLQNKGTSVCNVSVIIKYSEHE